MEEIWSTSKSPNHSILYRGRDLRCKKIEYVTHADPEKSLKPMLVLKRISDRVDLGNIADGISVIYNQYISVQPCGLVGFHVRLIIKSTQDVEEPDFIEL